MVEKSLDEIAVISVYNNDPSYLLPFLRRAFISDNSDIQSNITLVESLGRHPMVSEYRKVASPGHNLRDYCDFFSQNYSSLPDRMLLLKSNIVPRHIESLEIFEELISIGGVTMLWGDSNYRPNGFASSVLSPNFFIERNNSWFLNQQDVEYFFSFDQFLSFIFAEPIDRHFIPFAPGGCYSITREAVIRRPRSFWEFLSFISSYKHFPPEAYLVERCLYLAFISPEKTHPRFERGTWQQDLIDWRSSIRKPSAGIRKRITSGLLDLASRLS